VDEWESDLEDDNDDEVDEVWGLDKWNEERFRNEEWEEEADAEVELELELVKQDDKERRFENDVNVEVAADDDDEERIFNIPNNGKRKRRRRGREAWTQTNLSAVATVNKIMNVRLCYQETPHISSHSVGQQ